MKVVFIYAVGKAAAASGSDSVSCGSTMSGYAVVKAELAADKGTA